MEITQDQIKRHQQQQKSWNIIALIKRNLRQTQLVVANQFAGLFQRQIQIDTVAERAENLLAESRKVFELKRPWYKRYFPCLCW